MHTIANVIAALALLVVSGGCVEVERPGGPTGPAGDDPLDGPPSLRIAAPPNGQIVLRTEFTEEPGLRLVVSGEYLLDHRVRVEAYQNNHALPFSIHELQIEAGKPVPREFFLLGSEQHLVTATAATVYLHLTRFDGRDVSVDSVVLRVR